MGRITSCAAVLLLLAVSLSATAHAQIKQDYPHVRAVTAFINVDKGNYKAQIDGTAKFLNTAKAAFNQAGFGGAGGRITTQPFPQYISGLNRADALTLIGNIKQVAINNNVRLNIGPAMMNDDDHTGPADLLPAVLADGKAYASLIVADDKGIHWRALKVAAHVIHDLAANTPSGNGNFSFAAGAMVRPYTPYYPVSWHTGQGLHFAIALETANVVNRVFRQYHDPVQAQAHLTQELSRYTVEAEAVAKKLAADNGWTYEGIDATPAPGADFSIATAFESYLNAPIGTPGSETAAGIITRSVQATPVKRAGYSGLMVPVMEDKVLAQRWAEGAYTLDSIMAWSAVCAAGVDTVPLAGSTTEAQIALILSDVSWLATKWNKPLAIRLMPSPGKSKGDTTAFTADGLYNTKIH